MVITAVPKEAEVIGRKEFSLSAGDVLKVQLNGVDDSDLSYTVPAGKTATVVVYFDGTEA